MRLKHQLEYYNIHSPFTCHVGAAESGTSAGESFESSNAAIWPYAFGLATAASWLQTANCDANTVGRVVMLGARVEG